MPDAQIKTGPWGAKLPEDHLRVGISRGTPRRQPSGFRIYRKLAPGPWFNSVSIEEYNHLYRTEILGPLDPRVVAAELLEMGAGRVPVMLCFEWPGQGLWCHRAMAAEWLAEALGRPIPEVGFEALPQQEHPLMPASLRRPIATNDIADVTPYIGRSAMIDGELHYVTGADHANPGHALISVGTREFSTGIETLRRHF